MRRSIVLAPRTVQRMLFIALAIGSVGGCGPSVMTPTTVPGPLARQTGPAVTSVTSVTSVSGLPERLSDKDYWKLETDISEPGGYFRIEDNYTSNEMEIGQLYAMLRDSHVAGDVYGRRSQSRTLRTSPRFARRWRSSSTFGARRSCSI
jgi:hypothetical protein